MTQTDQMAREERFLRISPAAKRIIEEAADGSRKFRHRQIGADHYLLSLLERKNTHLLAPIFTLTGFSLQVFNELQGEMLVLLAQEKEGKFGRQTKSAKIAVERAWSITRGMNRSLMETVDLFAGILSLSETASAKCLFDRGFSLEETVKNIHLFFHLLNANVESFIERTMPLQNDYLDLYLSPQRKFSGLDLSTRHLLCMLEIGHGKVFDCLSSLIGPLEDLINEIATIGRAMAADDLAINSRMTNSRLEREVVRALFKTTRRITDPHKMEYIIAREQNSPVVKPEHLLLAFLRLPDNYVTECLLSHGITYQKAAEKLL